MTFPIYGKIKNVPNHQPDNDSLIIFNPYTYQSTGLWNETLLIWSGCALQLHSDDFPAAIPAEYVQNISPDELSVYQPQKDI